MKFFILILQTQSGSIYLYIFINPYLSFRVLSLLHGQNTKTVWVWRRKTKRPSETGHVVIRTIHKTYLLLSLTWQEIFRQIISLWNRHLRRWNGLETTLIVIKTDQLKLSCRKQCPTSLLVYIVLKIPSISSYKIYLPLDYVSFSVIKITTSLKPWIISSWIRNISNKTN